MLGKVCINIACGDCYVEEWRNFDYAPHSASVTQANLLNRLPVSTSEADVVYSSHFLEHVPRSHLKGFLSECLRILKSGGRLRLVTPDLEEMCRTYTAFRDREEHKKAEFLILEMLDQCVRREPGGELGEYYKALHEGAVPDMREMIDFVKSRTGHRVIGEITPKGSRWLKVIRNPSKFWRGLQKAYVRAIVSLLPKAFRVQNVSFAEVGERHAWIYDFQQVRELLERVGFVDVTRTTALSSAIDGFPFCPLDVYEDGAPRKGAESMYIEARKP